jgi:hypothetical protein
MKQYMLFIREDLNAVKQMSEAQLQDDIQQMVRWVEELSRTGNYVSGDPLEPEIRLTRKDEIFSDGPYIETKEAVSGYMIIAAANLDQAAQIAQTCPMLGVNIQAIEVRPILKF